MEQLLNTARTPKEDWIDVVTIQLTDIAHIWWAMEMERLTPPISWKAFSESFVKKFFSITAKVEMEW